LLHYKPQLLDYKPWRISFYFPNKQYHSTSPTLSPSTPQKVLIMHITITLVISTTTESTLASLTSSLDAREGNGDEKVEEREEVSEEMSDERRT